VTESLLAYIASQLPPLIARLGQRQIAALAEQLRPSVPALPLKPSPEQVLDLVGHTLRAISAWEDAIARQEGEFAAFREAWFAQTDRAARRALAESVLRMQTDDRAVPWTARDFKPTRSSDG